MLMRFFIYKMLMPFLNKVFLGKVEGLENIPQGAYIVASNHSSSLDPMILPTLFWFRWNIQLRYLAKKELFKGYLARKFFETGKIIKLDKDDGKEGLKNGLEALAKGDKIGIFPEGTRAKDGELQKAKTGVARLALRAKVPVVPTGVIGGHEAWPRGRLLPRLKKVDIKFGKPIMFEGNPDDHEVLTKITTHVMKKIAGLTGKAYDF